MQNKILKLVRRSKNIDLSDIIRYLETDLETINPVLNELIAEHKITKNGDIYSYVDSPIRQKAHGGFQPDVYEYHNKNTIMQVVACFCAEVTSKQAALVLGINRGSVDKFYKHFKQEIFNLQNIELSNCFQKSPKVGRVRAFDDKVVYLYLYNNKLYVSERMLNGIKLKDYTESERLKIKNLYKRAYKKKNNHIYKTYYHYYIAEQIWRCDKDDSLLLEELSEILSPFIK